MSATGATRPSIRTGGPAPRQVVIDDADLGWPDGRRGRVRVSARDGDAVVESVDPMGPTGVAPMGEVLHAGGNAVLPAFTDHHLHLHAMAAADSSTDCGPGSVRDVGELGLALRTAETDTHGWIRGTGYFESVAGDLTRHEVDRLRCEHPVRIQHRSGALWMLNTVALTRCGITDRAHPGVEVDADGRPTGRIWRADAWLRTRLPVAEPPALGGVGARLRASGIAEVTDATPDLGARRLRSLISAVDRGDLTGRLHLLGVGIGHTVQHPRITLGPYKIIIADSDPPALDDLCELIAAAHAADRPVAVHCVSRVGLALLIAAWHIVGARPGDRIEHAALVPADTLRSLAGLGVVVVTQPGFLAHRGDDFLSGTEPAEHQDLYRCGALLAAGIPVALSSDAPYGPLNPWTTIAAAVARTTPRGHRVGTADESVDVIRALGLHSAPASEPGGRPRRIRPGARADLMVLDRPLREVVRAPADVRVVATVIDGQLR
ncbi:amidohydrolase family protein [Gordonia soli]|uniref:Amidohydrolase 3 domain-containing protein n=1 Tax=Gordonia soli NBRC 108243 TaxID=1223545 RepID=M0QIB1_9ACTN|nr:amidohydrolase family protein [Gordonia soli]GAC68189.1 hypothetical protein GS4_14_00180 [Gordonia soli NBRC 108243]